jgi:sugar lactone lactonase YvrE
LIFFPIIQEAFEILVPTALLKKELTVQKSFQYSSSKVSILYVFFRFDLIVSLGKCIMTLLWILVFITILLIESLGGNIAFPNQTLVAKPGSNQRSPEFFQNLNRTNLFSGQSLAYKLPSSKIAHPSISLESISPNLFMQLVAGNGTHGYSGDAGPATSAAISTFIPFVDTIGNIYLPDHTKFRIRKINTAGIITTFGGSGISAITGTSGSIGVVSFYFPYSIVGDAGGTVLYISDLQYVWKYVFNTNIVSVYAHSTSLAPGFSGDNGAATSAQLYLTAGIWLTTSNTLYIADHGNHRIRTVLSNGIITTVAGSGCSSACSGSFSGENVAATTANLKNPRSVYVDTYGILFIADFGNNRIRVVGGDNKISTFAGNGGETPFSGDNIAATAATVFAPYDVKGDSAGNIYIADSGNCIISVVNRVDGIITTLFGNPLLSCGNSPGISHRSSPLGTPTGIWVDTQNMVYFSTYMMIHRGLMVSSPTSQPTEQPSTRPLSQPSRQPTSRPTNQPSSQPSSQPSRQPSTQPTGQPSSHISSNVFMQLVAGTGTSGFSGENGPATLAQIRAIIPFVDSSGNMYIPDYTNRVIRKVSRSSGMMTRFGGTGNGASNSAGGGTITSIDFYDLYSIVGDSSGSFLYISDQYFVWKYSFATNGAFVYAHFPSAGPGFSGNGGEATSAQLNNPTGLWLTTSGVLYIADSLNNQIRKVSSVGIISTVAGGGVAGDNTPATSASLNYPRGVYVDTNGQLFIADSANNRIRLVDTNNIITTFAGSGTASPFNGNNLPKLSANIKGAWDVKGDSIGTIYIADFDNCIIRMVVGGIISTLFGTPTSCTGFSSGITPRSAVIGGPWGLWLDTFGNNLYFSDYGSIHRSVDLSPTTQPSGRPTRQPSSQPTRSPSRQPSSCPSSQPSHQPTSQPASQPSVQPSSQPSKQPSTLPTSQPSRHPTRQPSCQPSGRPSSQPSCRPTNQPTDQPSSQPSSQPSKQPSTLPTSQPSRHPTRQPSCQPSGRPSSQPSCRPTNQPTDQPSSQPSSQPSKQPSCLPTSKPSRQPTGRPSCQPSGRPSSQPSAQPSFASPILFMKLVAGTNTTGYSGDSGPATSARMTSYISYVDTNGNIYLPDNPSSRIRKINTAGIISLFGGTTTASTGVTALIQNAQFAYPYGIVGDTVGTALYISDILFVWKYVFSTSIVSVIAHSASLPQGFGGDNGAASLAQLYQPLGIWLTTSGVLYIADHLNHRIRKVSLPGGIITTVVGSGCNSNCVGSSSGDNGAATSATLDHPRGLYVDSMGKLFLTESQYNNRIRLVDTNNIITTFAGSGTASPFNGDSLPKLSANIQGGWDVKGDSLGNIYIADLSNCIIRVVDTHGIVSTLFGTPGVCGFTSATPSGLILPRSSRINPAVGIWLDSLSNIYFSDVNSIHRGTLVSSPTSQPSMQPTVQPFSIPTRRPTSQPSNQPTRQPTGQPTKQPVTLPTGHPSLQPTTRPTGAHPAFSIPSNLFMQLIAGTNSSGYSGDNGPATLARIHAVMPWVDSSGNIYVPGDQDCRMRKIDSSSGIITAFGGTVSSSVNGVTGPIGTTTFYYPWSIVGDTAGTVLYISDLFFVWQYVFSTNIVTVIAQSPSLAQGFSGDNGPAASAQLNTPMGLWLTTTGVLYVADYGNHRIRKITSSQPKVISTVVGSGLPSSGGYSGDNGPAFSAALNFPRGVYADTSGRMFIADTNNNRVRLVDTNNIITTFAGSGSDSFTSATDNVPAIAANIYSPRDVKGDSQGNIYIADYGFSLIRVVDNRGIISTLFVGSSGFSPGFSARLNTKFNFPVGIWVDTRGTVYFSDYNSIHRGAVVSNPTSQPSGQPSRQPSGQPSSHPTVMVPVAIPDNLLMTVVAGTGTAGYSNEDGPATSAKISAYYPWVDSSGNIYLPNDVSNRIRKIDSLGIITLLGGTGVGATTGKNGPIGSTSFYSPFCVVGDQTRTVLYISDQLFVWKYEFSTNDVTVLAHSPGLVAGFGGDNGPASLAQLNNPNGLWITTSGELYIADRGNHRIRKVVNGMITTMVGSSTGSYSGDNGPAIAATIHSPSGIFVDTNGRLFIADLGNNRIRVVDISNNIITTFAGTGTAGPFNGNNISATLANLNIPWDVKGDSVGNIYITDSGNCIIRMVDSRRLISTLFGTLGSCGFTPGVSSRTSAMNFPAGLWVDSLSNLYFSDVSSLRRGVLAQSPTSQPSGQPSRQPTSQPSRPSGQPSTQPTRQPSDQPTSHPTKTSSPSFPFTNNLFMKLVAGVAGGGDTGENGPATSAQIRSYFPWVDTAGNIYLPGDSARKIRRVTSSDGIITTFAGTGVESKAGISGPASSLNLNYPFAIVGDTAGTVLYFTDQWYVWKYLFSTNMATVYAQSTSVTHGFDGDGGPASSAKLNNPLGLWLTTEGVLYVSDNNNHRIRKIISSTEIITTVAGNGGSGGFSGENGPAISAALNFPRGLFMDTNGRLFIADYSNHRIRLVNNNNIITTFAGTGTANPFNGDNRLASTANINFPNDVKGDSAGNIYISSWGACVVHRVDNNGIISVVFGSNPGSCGYSPGISSRSSPLNPLYGLWVDSVATVYFSDYNSVHKSVVVSSPTSQPSGQPSRQPSSRPSMPSGQPSSQPTRQPVGNPSSPPTSQPSTRPTSQPTRQPAMNPSARPTMQPMSYPSSQPTLLPSSQPTRQPAGQPTSQPSVQPMGRPSSQPSCSPSSQPFSFPSSGPSSQPTRRPSSQPTSRPSKQPSSRSSSQPTAQPTIQPTGNPTTQPSSRPTVQPSRTPTQQPTANPSGQPSSVPSERLSNTPSNDPTSQPSGSPSTSSGSSSSIPSTQPSTHPTNYPTNLPSSSPTVQPSSRPSVQPIVAPTGQPSSSPTTVPTEQPTSFPPSVPSYQPSSRSSVSSQPTTVLRESPASHPSVIPSSQPTVVPSADPSLFPSSQPTSSPTVQPSTEPSVVPTETPVGLPTSRPSVVPSLVPTVRPTSIPSLQPRSDPSLSPIVSPSGKPLSIPSSALHPSGQPLSSPSGQPSSQPTKQPSSHPSRQPVSRPSGHPSRQPSVHPTILLSRKPTVASPPPFSPQPSTTTIPTFSPTATFTILTTTSTPPEFKGFILPLNNFIQSSESLLVNQNIDFQSQITTIGSSSFIVFGRKKKYYDFSFGDSTTDTYSYYTKLNKNNEQQQGGMMIADKTSRSVTVLGDINGDSLSDIILGNPLTSTCFVYLGKERNRFVNLPLSFVISSGEENSGNDFFGWATATLGDCNNDGRNDFMISAIYANTVYVLYGTKSFPPNNNNLIIGTNAFNGFTVIGSATDINFGMSISSAGDFNNDGLRDYLVSSMSGSSSLSAQNIIYIIFSNHSTRAGDVLSIDQLPLSRYYKIIAPKSSFAGFSLAALGDINQDGFDDIVIGSIPYQGGYSSQKCYVLYGRRSLSLLLSDNNLLITEMREGEEGFTITGGGFAVAGPGDVNNDGLNDILIVDYRQWQGKGNSFLLFYPGNNSHITVPPTLSPSSSPLNHPSSSPTSHPSQMIVIESPTNRPSSSSPSVTRVMGTFPPFLSATLPPTTKAPQTTKPTRIPSVVPSTRFPTTRMPLTVSPTVTGKPSLRPTRSPSLIPSRTPTIKPSVSPTFRPSRSPSFFPSSYPTFPSSVSIPFTTITITSNGSYSITSSEEEEGGTKGITSKEIIISGTGNIVLRNDGNNKQEDSRDIHIYRILPRENIITILDFRTKHDILDLIPFSDSFTSLKDLPFRSHPLTFFLSEKQRIILKNHEEIDLTEENFYFSSSSPSSTETFSEPRTTVRIDSSLIISLVILVVGAMVVLLLVCLPSFQKKKEEKEEHALLNWYSLPAVMNDIEDGTYREEKGAKKNSDDGKLNKVAEKNESIDQEEEDENENGEENDDSLSLDTDDDDEVDNDSLSDFLLDSDEDHDIDGLFFGENETEEELHSHNNGHTNEEEIGRSLDHDTSHIDKESSAELEDEDYEGPYHEDNSYYSPGVQSNNNQNYYPLDVSSVFANSTALAYYPNNDNNNQWMNNSNDTINSDNNYNNCNYSPHYYDNNNSNNNDNAPSFYPSADHQRMPPFQYLTASFSTTAFAGYNKRSSSLAAYDEHKGPSAAIATNHFCPTAPNEVS